MLRAGARASEYASHLLEVARSMQPRPSSGARRWPWRGGRSWKGGCWRFWIRGSTASPIRGTAAPAVAALLAAVLVAPFAAVRAQDQPAQPCRRKSTPPSARPTRRRTTKFWITRRRSTRNCGTTTVAQTLLESALAIRGEVSGQQSAAYAAGLVKLGDLEAKRSRQRRGDAFYTKAVGLGDRPEVAPRWCICGMRAYSERMTTLQAPIFSNAPSTLTPNGPQAGPAMTWMAAVRDAQAGLRERRTQTVDFRVDTVWNTATQKYDPLTSAEAECLLQKALARRRRIPWTRP